MAAATRSIREASESTNETCELCGGIGFYGVNVPVGHADFGKVITCDCRKAQIEEKRTAAIFDNLRDIPEQYQNRTFETWDALPAAHRKDKEAARQNTETFAENGVLEREYSKRYWGIVLASTATGHGKSGLAASIMVRRTQRGVGCLWIDFRKFLRMTYSTIQKDAEYSYEDIVGVADSVPFLVWDDFADVEQRGNISDYVRNVVYDVISQRYRERLPTVITTNLDIDKLYSQFGDRIGDRVCEMCYWQPVGGVNLRFAEET